MHSGHGSMEKYILIAIAVIIGLVLLAWFVYSAIQSYKNGENLPVVTTTPPPTTPPTT
jgi:tellurite resistance protein TehA-like permease